MNYQHAFHAGNFADVHKHAVLVRILEHLRRKDTPFRIIDTHAGAGRYDLLGEQAQRSGEWRDGIKPVWEALRQDGAHGGRRGRDDAEAAVLLAPYLAAIAALNPGGALRTYPGSPLIAEALLRAQDRLIACEAEPRAAAALKTALRGDARAKALLIDGWTALRANVPPKERRGLVLVDPPFEAADDFERLATALATAHRKWPTGIYMLWYPIKDRLAPDALARRLRRLPVPKVLRSEVLLGPPRAEAGLIGSGLILVNPPFPLEPELQRLLPVLSRLFGPQAHHRLDRLAGEA